MLRQVDIPEIVGLVELLMNQGHGFHAMLALAQDPSDVLRAVIRLEPQQARDHLQIVFYAVVDFLEQDVFLGERACELVPLGFERTDEHRLLGRIDRAAQLFGGEVVLDQEILRACFHRRESDVSAGDPGEHQDGEDREIGRHFGSKADQEFESGDIGEAVIEQHAIRRGRAANFEPLVSGSCLEELKFGTISLLEKMPEELAVFFGVIDHYDLHGP